MLTRCLIFPCTGLNTSSTYYVEMAGAQHSNNGTDYCRPNNGGNGGNYRGGFLQLIHYKKN